VAHCLSRGTFFLQRGSTISTTRRWNSDAFSSSIRPTSARKNLDRIKSQQGGNNRTLTIDAVEANQPAPASARKTTSSVPARASRPDRPPRPRRHTWTMRVGGLAVAAALATAIWFVMNPSREIAPSRSVPPSTASMGDKSTADIPLAARSSGRAPTQAQKDSLATARADSILAAGGLRQPKRASTTAVKAGTSGTTRPQGEASKATHDDGKSSPSLASRDASSPPAPLPRSLRNRGIPARRARSLPLPTRLL
jgi:hypothetical protein